MLEVIDAQEKRVGGSMTGACAKVGDVAEDEDTDATADGGGSDSSVRAVRSGDGAAADDGGGDCAMVGCTTAVEDVTEV